MIEPIVDSADPELEYNIYDNSYLQYRGKVFTGTLIDSDTNPISFSEYKDGNAHGRQVSYHRNGRIHSDHMSEDGCYISGKEWYDNGQFRYDSNDGHVYWDADGLLTKRGEIWFYKDGSPRNTKDENGRTILSRDGHVAIRNTRVYEIKGDNSGDIIFYSDVITKSLTDLYANIYTHPDDNFSFRGIIDHQINHYIFTLYYRNFKDLAIATVEQIIRDAEQRQIENNNFVHTHFEKTLLHNSKITKEHLENDKMDLYGSGRLDNLAKIVF